MAPASSLLYIAFGLTTEDMDRTKLLFTVYGPSHVLLEWLKEMIDSGQCAGVRDTTEVTLHYQYRNQPLDLILSTTAPSTPTKRVPCIILEPPPSAYLYQNDSSSKDVLYNTFNESLASWTEESGPFHVDLQLVTLTSHINFPGLPIGITSTIVALGQKYRLIHEASPLRRLLDILIRGAMQVCPSDVFDAVAIQSKQTAFEPICEPVDSKTATADTLSANAVNTPRFIVDTSLFNTFTPLDTVYTPPSNAVHTSPLSAVGTPPSNAVAKRPSSRPHSFPFPWPMIDEDDIPGATSNAMFDFPTSETTQHAGAGLHPDPGCRTEAVYARANFERLPHTKTLLEMDMSDVPEYVDDYWEFEPERKGSVYSQPASSRSSSTIRPTAPGDLRSMPSNSSITSQQTAFADVSTTGEDDLECSTPTPRVSRGASAPQSLTPALCVNTKSNRTLRRDSTRPYPDMPKVNQPDGVRSTSIAYRSILPGSDSILIDNRTQHIPVDHAESAADIVAAFRRGEAVSRGDNTPRRHSPIAAVIEQETFPLPRMSQLRSRSVKAPKTSYDWIAVHPLPASANSQAIFESDVRDDDAWHLVDEMNVSLRGSAAVSSRNPTSTLPPRAVTDVSGPVSVSSATITLKQLMNEEFLMHPRTVPDIPTSCSPIAQLISARVLASAPDPPVSCTLPARLPWTRTNTLLPILAKEAQSAPGGDVPLKPASLAVKYSGPGGLQDVNKGGRNLQEMTTSSTLPRRVRIPQPSVPESPPSPMPQLEHTIKRRALPQQKVLTKSSDVSLSLGDFSGPNGEFGLYSDPPSSTARPDPSTATSVALTPQARHDGSLLVHQPSTSSLRTPADIRTTASKIPVLQPHDTSSKVECKLFPSQHSPFPSSYERPKIAKTWSTSEPERKDPSVRPAKSVIFNLRKMFRT